MEDSTPEDKPNGDEMIPKSQFLELQARAEKLEKDLEDTRIEVLTPEYQKFLEESSKPKESEKPKDKEVPEDEFEKLSKKEIFERAVKQAEENIQSSLSKREETERKKKDLQIQREIAELSKAHSDFGTYRPIMYGLSLDPKNANLSLTDLYNMAKEHVKRLGGSVDEGTKKKVNRSQNEKPGLDNESLVRLKKMDDTEIALETIREMQESGIDTDNLSMI